MRKVTKQSDNFPERRRKRSNNWQKGEGGKFWNGKFYIDETEDGFNLMKHQPDDLMGDTMYYESAPSAEDLMNDDEVYFVIQESQFDGDEDGW